MITESLHQSKPPLEGDAIFPYSKWERVLPQLSDQYRKNLPFPHIILDDFLTPQAAEEALAKFPKMGSDGWIHYVHFNEKKLGKNDIHNFDPVLKNVLTELNSDRFIQFLSALTGIEGIFKDDTFEGGGLHQTGPGGFLNIHADFTVHPHHRDWRRRINVLVYLNKDWKESYGGHLELWDQKVKNCAHRVLPIFNRAVIFNTDHDAFHGQPEPLKCPEDMTRKSLALYYFSHSDKPHVQSTEYRGRPDENAFKKAGIYLDKQVLRLYDAVKRKCGFDDKLASNTLALIDKIKRSFKKSPRS